jgi:hypothetical protein
MLKILDYLVMGGGVLIAAFLLINMFRETFIKKSKID